MKKPLLVIFLILIFYISFVAYSDFGKFSSNILHFKFYYIPLVLLLGFSERIILALRQQLLFKKIDINIPLKQSILLYFASLSMTITPAGSGQVIKSYFLKKKYDYSMTKSYPIVFVERFHDLLAPLIILSILLLFEKISTSITLVIILGIISILVYVAVRIHKLFEYLAKILIRLPKLQKFANNVIQSHDIFYSLTTKKITIKSIFLSLVAWIIDAVVAYIIFNGFGLNFSFISTTIMVFSSVLFGAISLLPGGVGLTELSLVSFLTKKGLEISLVTSVIILTRLVGLWYPTILGFISTKLFLSKT